MRDRKRLTERFRSLDRIPTPDLWPDSRQREPADLSIGPGWKRVAVASLALAVAAAGIGAAGWAFLGGESARRTINPTEIVPKANGRIAFVGGKGRSASPGNDRIIVMNEDGTGIHRLVAGKDPAWSPDGSSMAYVVGGDAPPYQLQVWDEAAGRSRLLLNENQFIQGPTWSPDGQQLAIAMGVSGGYDVYIVNADGSGLHRITSLGGSARDPTWSPDGSGIVFVATEGPTIAIMNLFVVKPDGTGLTRLTEGTRTALSPTWAPDGERVAFIDDAGQDGRSRSIRVMSADGTGVRSLFSCTSCLSDVAWSPDGKKLVFTRSSRSAPHLWTMNVDGSNLHEIDTGAVLATSPAWQPVPISPPKTGQIAPSANGEIWFRRGGGEGGTWIEAVDPDGSNRRVLFSDTYAGGDDQVGSTYAWSADGSRLAFLDAVGLPGYPGYPDEEVFTMNPDGTGRYQVTHDGGADGPPSWSPDGTRIAYASDRGDPNRPACMADLTCDRDIFVIDADGTGQVRLTDDPGFDWQPDWSPDGTRIAFVKGGGVLGGDLYLMNPDGSAQERLAGTSGTDSQPRWSPDGSRIAFVRHEHGEFDLYIVGADGSDPRQVATGLPATHSVQPDLFRDFSWSPDGTRIAFVGGDEAGTVLYSVDADGGETTKLAEDPSGIGEPAWRPVPG